MILEHFQLRSRPFEAVADSRFYFPTPDHDRALALLHYAARNAGEAALLCGPPGCGKTLLLRTVRRQLPREQFTVVFAPQTPAADLIERLARFLPAQLAPPEADPHTQLLAVARTCAHADRALVIMLDGDAGPNNESFTALGWLLNLDVPDLRVAALLTAHDAPPQTDRLLGVATIDPLPADQVPAYLAHRLRVAGHPDGQLFEPPAADRVARLSAGVPRTIHRIANLAMHAAALEKRDRVTQADVDAAAERLGQIHPPLAARQEART